jgi:hypothetical protein
MSARLYATTQSKRVAAPTQRRARAKAQSTDKSRKKPPINMPDFVFANQ